MRDAKNDLNRMFALARRAPQPTPVALTSEPPLGFTTRMAAEWSGQQARTALADRWEWLCWGGVAAAALVCLSVTGPHWWRPEPGIFEQVLNIPQGPTGIF